MGRSDFGPSALRLSWVDRYDPELSAMAVPAGVEPPLAVDRRCSAL